MPFDVPNPDKYRGIALRRYIEDLYKHLLRSRLVQGPGVLFEETPGGIVLRASVGGVGVAIVKTTGTITARSGTTPGTGNAVLVTWNGSALGTGAAITLKNVSATAGSTGKYGFAVSLFGLYWMVSLEC